MPAQKSIAIQLSVRNSGSASAPPNLTEPYLPKANHNRTARHAKVNQRKTKPKLWVMKSITRLRTAAL